MVWLQLADANELNKMLIDTSYEFVWPGRGVLKRWIRRRAADPAQRGGGVGCFGSVGHLTIDRIFTAEGHQHRGASSRSADTSCSLEAHPGAPKNGLS